MIDKKLIKNTLYDKKNEFHSFKDSVEDTYSILIDLYSDLVKYSDSMIIDKISDNNDAAIALPTKEWNKKNCIVKFPEKWTNHEDARQWAYNILLDKVTAAFDTSQIMPSKDIYPPVAAIQGAEFENCHSKSAKYNKNVKFNIITALEIKNNEDKYLNIEHFINFKRFLLELDLIIDYMKRVSKKAYKPVVFYDGSLVLSFITAEGATGKNIDLYNSYIKKMIELLKISEDNKIPLLGYIDISRSTDIVNLLNLYFGEDNHDRINDAQLLSSSMEWGDRTPIFNCKRPGVLSHYGDYKDQISFTYLKANSKMPVRVEFLNWLYDDYVLFEKVLNILRAEIVIGCGYVYAIESADSAAVITNRDKNEFYNIYFDFISQNNIQCHLSGKLRSKLMRR